jgi:hypothetical protein
VAQAGELSAMQLQAQMDELRAVADALWGDWRPRPPDVHGWPKTLLVRYAPDRDMTVRWKAVS